MSCVSFKVSWIGEVPGVCKVRWVGEVPGACRVCWVGEVPGVCKVCWVGEVSRVRDRIFKVDLKVPRGHIVAIVHRLVTIGQVEVELLMIHVVMVPHRLVISDLVIHWLIVRAEFHLLGPRRRVVKLLGNVSLWSLGRNLRWVVDRLRNTH